MDNRPIGVFDSGLGGITTVRGLKKLMPNENIIYFGDTSRVPYGTRSRETIQKYTKQDINFLLAQDVKMVVCACNTSSTNLPTEFINTLPVPFTGVLIPAVQSACMSTKTGRIGVIATSATIKSGAYGRAIREVLHKAVVIGNSCPMLVPLIENGYVDPQNPVTTIIAHEYLEPILKESIDTLILGCTHYPIIKSLIAQIIGDEIKIVDSGEETAHFVQAFLTREHLLSGSVQMGECQFFVSDNIEGFAANAGAFLSDDISGNVERINIDEF